MLFRICYCMCACSCVKCFVCYVVCLNRCQVAAAVKDSPSTTVVVTFDDTLVSKQRHTNRPQFALACTTADVSFANESATLNAVKKIISTIPGASTTIAVTGIVGSSRCVVFATRHTLAAAVAMSTLQTQLATSVAKWAFDSLVFPQHVRTRGGDLLPNASRVPTAAENNIKDEIV